MTVSELCKTAKLNSATIAYFPQAKANALLQTVASAIRTNVYYLLDENARDVDVCNSGQLVDLIRLNRTSVESLARKLERMMGMPSPLGEILEQYQTPNGMEICKLRVPLGTVGILFEDDVSFLVESVGMCLKTGNAVAIMGNERVTYTVRALVKVIKEGIAAFPMNAEFVQGIDFSKRNLSEFLRANDSLDAVICKGEKQLKAFVKENATVPVIMTGNARSQVYIESSANVLMATHLLVNSVTENTNAPYACKGLVVDESIARSFLPFALGILREKGVIVKGDKRAKSFLPDLPLATDRDFLEGASDLLTVRIVRDISDAIAYINIVSSHVCDMIVTKNISFAERFVNEVDSAIVYVNASTSFTDGYEFGIGEDLGVSVQKIHARGLIGLRELTSVKYRVLGNGQIRN